MSAVGAALGVLVRNTAVPGTRVGGLFSSMRTSSSSEISWRRVLSNNNRLPRRHVYMTTITKPPNASGTQPPSTTLSRLAPRNVRSTNRNGTISAAAASGGHRHTFQITTNAIVTVTTMVPVTAMP